MMGNDERSLSLKWRKRTDGLRVAYWICPSSKIYAKFTPRTVRLWSGYGQPSAEEVADIEAGCRRMQDEIVEFAMNPRRNHRPERRTGNVYFIRSRNLIKIGYTAGKPLARLSKLQIGSPTKLELLGSIEGDAVIERQLHWRFKMQHSHGEWFFCEGALRTYVNKLFSIESTSEQVQNRT